MKKIAVVAEINIPVRVIVNVRNDFDIENAFEDDKVINQIIKKITPEVKTRIADGELLNYLVDIEEDYDDPYEPFGIDKGE